MSERESDDNILISCKDCSEKLYPNRGRWQKSDMKFATHVKKNFDGEHMWVKISCIQEDGIIGTVDNIPIKSESPILGTVVFVKYTEMEDVT